MKKIILSAIIILFTSAFAIAQINKPEVIKKKTVAVKTTPAPAPVNNPGVYTLTSARVIIKTGSDNKEFPSKVNIWLMSRGGGYAMNQPGENLRNEMKVNSSTELGLQNTSWASADNRLLTAFQKEGLMIRIQYMANFPTDAWKIEGVSVILEFKDQNGNLHPTLGSKTIVFNNAVGFLNYWDGTMECTADNSFVPLTSSIKQ